MARSTLNSWADFEAAEPALARFASDRLDGKVSFLATTRRDGSPRVHPVTPIFREGRLLMFMEPTSPKGHDLRRDGRYSLHCSVTDNTGASGEVLVRGLASLVGDPDVRAMAMEATESSLGGRFILFEFSVEEVASTEYEDAMPVRRGWKRN